MNLPSDFKKFSSKQSALLIGLAFCLLGMNSSALGQGSQNLLSLRQNAEQFLLTHYQSDKNEQLEIKLGHWDRRLHLTACQQEIAFSLQDTAGEGGNITLSCQCRDARGWTVHLPAQVDIYRALPVAARNLSRGGLINASDIRMETRNISQMADASELDNSSILGKALKRSVNAGDTIKASLLDDPKAISRGEIVSITAKSGGIHVVMQGTAMTDGKLGQQIRVKNSQSERIINAKVVGQAAVEIL